MLKVTNNKLGDYVMKAKVSKNILDDYNQSFKVRRMNYDHVLVDYPINSGIKSFKLEDVELISENRIDDFLISNKQYLKIKLKRGISVAFYSALQESIKIELNEDAEVLNVLYDRYKINKRGIWDKQLIILVNNKYPLEIDASGQNFRKDSYNINIRRIEQSEFIEICREEIKRIELDISEKEKEKESFQEAIDIYM